MRNIFEDLNFCLSNYTETKKHINQIGDNYCKLLHKSDSNICPNCEEVKYIKTNKNPVKIIYTKYNGLEYEYCFKYMTIEEFMSYDTIK